MRPSEETAAATEDISPTAMTDFPDFFADAPTITLYDPPARFLGATGSGLLTYGYTDAVKLAGHSCPTVAGAYLMVRRGLAELYGEDLPERGAVEVHLRDPRDQGTTGVIASIATLITGAAPETGFGGIGADRRFERRNLLRFDAPIEGLLALRRCDDGRAVVLDLDAAVVPPDPQMGPLFAQAVAGDAESAAQDRFAAMWQDRVARMLEHADDDRLIRVTDWRNPDEARRTAPEVAKPLAGRLHA